MIDDKLKEIEGYCDADSEEKTMAYCHVYLPKLVNALRCAVDTLKEYAHSNEGGPNMTFHKADLSRKALKEIETILEAYETK